MSASLRIELLPKAPNRFHPPLRLVHGEKQNILQPEDTDSIHKISVRAVETMPDTMTLSKQNWEWIKRQVVEKLERFHGARKL